MTALLFLLLTCFNFFRVQSVLARSSESTCPSFCECDTWYGLKRASCIGRHIYSIYTGVPSSVEALDLHDNSISSLNNCELADAGLTKLKYLNLSKNSISEIGLEAFAGLNDLSVLDLSRNHLYHILPAVFSENKALRVLKLANNHFNLHVPKLQCPWLTELDLQSCQITHIPVDTFKTMTQLRRLNLANNLMIQFDSAILQPLRFLKKLSLSGNPWSCNKMMNDLRLFLRVNKIEHDGVCEKTSEPKKFDKMILRPMTNSNTRVSVSNNNSRGKSVDPFAPVEVTNTSFSSNDTENRKICSKMYQWGSMSSYWFLGMGFLLGCAVGTVCSYAWFSKRFNCRRESSISRNDPQRLFLLQNQHLTEASAASSSQTISCPGTPPPPYHDVILRSALYLPAT